MPASFVSATGKRAKFLQLSWDAPAHTLTWGTSSWVNCSTLDPNSTRDCLDSTRELDLMLTHDVVYIQGYEFGRELLEDDFTPALLEAQALRAHMKARALSPTLPASAQEVERALQAGYGSAR